MARQGRFGLQAYALILSLITHRQMTPRQVAAEIDGGRQSVMEVLWMMERLGLAHVVAWIPPTQPRSSFLQALFSAGEGVSVPYPTPLARSPGGGAKGARPELVHFATIVRELRDGATRAEIIERCGTMHHNLSPLLRRMRDLGIARVAGWQVRDRDAGMPAEVWQMGFGPDARRPRALTSRQKQARYRDRRRARTAALRVVHAIAGTQPIVKHGVQSYHLLGGAT
jgi:hypothetical protein